MTAVRTLLDFFSAIRECEQRYPVSQWSVSGVAVWPLVRIEGRAELLLRNASGTGPTRSRSRLAQFLRHAASPILQPLQNFSDWKHETLRLHPVDAVFLGDGVSQDFIHGAWHDRYCAPVMDSLAACGAESLLMQPNEQRLPRERSTYSAQWVASWGGLLARARPARDVRLLGYDEVREFLAGKGFTFAVLERAALEQRGMRVAAMARLFDYVLARTRPTIGFAVSYYWDMGFAFNLACRRRGVLSIDIQHGAQDGRHEAYNLWSSVPEGGYAVLPDVFWTWTEADACAIDAWAGDLRKPWHRSLWGGHPQLAEWQNNASPKTQQFDAKISAIKQRSDGTFDILVALQDLEQYGAVWDKLADAIQSSPPAWRWWLRRHPSPAYNRGHSIKKLTALKRSNVIVEEASSYPLPALLRNMDAVITLMSSTAMEATFFGHRPVFLTQDARMQFAEIFASDRADVITNMDALIQHLKTLERGRTAGPQYHSPDLRQKVCDLLKMTKSLAAETSSGGGTKIPPQNGASEHPTPADRGKGAILP